MDVLVPFRDYNHKVCVRSVFRLYRILWVVVILVWLLPSTCGIDEAPTNKIKQQQKKQHSQYVVHAQRLIAANEPSMALKEVLEGLKIYKDSIELSMILGVSYVSLNQCPEAIQAYKRALKLISKQEKQQPTSIPLDHTKLSNKAIKDYKLKALTWVGVCLRRLGKGQEAIPWLEASVANDRNNGGRPTTRENRHHLAHSYLTFGRYLDSAEQLASIFENAAKSAASATFSSSTAATIKPDDADYYLLSMILSTMEEWSLLEQALSHCLAHGCSLATVAYPAVKVHVEYSVALEQSGRLEESLAELKQAAALLSPALSSVSSSKQEGDENNLVHVREMANSYLQSARQRSKQRSPFSSSKEQEKWRSVTQALWSATKNSTSPAAWSIVNSRHVQGFNWPIPLDLLQQIRQELKADRESARATASFNHTMVPSFTTLPNRTTPCVLHYTCLMLPVYTLEDCIFYAKVQSARLQQHLIAKGQKQGKSSNNKIEVMGYSDFAHKDYPNLDAEQPSAALLHIGLFSADLKTHPMLDLLRAFVKYHQHAALPVKVTLYHTAADPVILEEVKDQVDDMVACTQDTWQDCVKHARQNKVHVWLETTGRTGDGIPSIAASGPAPVGVIWAGFPGSMGMPSTLQYMVSDRYTVPPHDSSPQKGSENHNNTSSYIAAQYPEKMIYVPGSWMIAESSAQEQETRIQNIRTDHEKLVLRRELRDRYQIPPDAFVFGYFGRIWKLSDKVFQTFCQIVQRVPGSVLLMLDYYDGNNIDASPITRIRQQWKQHGGGGGVLDESRLIVLPPFARGEHIAAQEALVDVSLDSVSYSGGATSLDAIRAGRPLVHCPGGLKMTQRSAGSVLTAAGLADVLIGKDLHEYEEIAVRLGLDKVFYEHVLERVANDAMRSILFQPQVSIAAMVSGMRQAYQLWRTGHAPQTIMADAEEEEESHDDGRQPPPVDEIHSSDHPDVLLQSNQDLHLHLEL